MPLLAPASDRLAPAPSSDDFRANLARQYLTWVRTTISFLAGAILLALEAAYPGQGLGIAGLVAIGSGAVAVVLVVAARRVGFPAVVRTSIYLDLVIIPIFVTRFETASLYDITFLWVIVVAAAFGTPRDAIAATGGSVLLTLLLPSLVGQPEGPEVYLEALMIAVVGGMVSAIGIDEFRARGRRSWLERQLREAQRIAKVGSFDFDPATDEARWSEEMHRIFDVPGGVPLGQAAFLETIVPEDRQRVTDAFVEAMSTHGDSDIIATIRRGDGETRAVRVLGTYVRDGDRMRVVGTVQDITELRRLDAMRDEFVAAASHELRTPTSIVLGFAATLGAQWHSISEDDRLRFVGEIEGAAERLSMLIEDVLQVTQIESGNVHCAREPFDLYAEIDDLLRTWPGELDVELEGAQADGERLVALADATRTRQVMVNLLQNAERHADGARTPVRVRIERDGRFLRTHVIDGGPGIPAESQDRIFERFARFGSARAGTGLGLYISRRLAEAQGGSLVVSSEPGHGSTFTFALPADPGRLDA